MLIVPSVAVNKWSHYTGIQPMFL